MFLDCFDEIDMYRLIEYLNRTFADVSPEVIPCKAEGRAVVKYGRIDLVYELAPKTKKIQPTEDSWRFTTPTLDAVWPFISMVEYWRQWPVPRSVKLRIELDLSAGIAPVEYPVELEAAFAQMRDRRIKK